MELDPFSPLMHKDLGAHLYEDRRCGEAEKHLRRAFELAPEAPGVRVLLSECSLLDGDEDEALEHVLETVRSARPRLADTLRAAFETSGWDGIDRLAADGKLDDPLLRAAALTRLGRLDEAVATLRAGYERGSPQLIVAMKAIPWFDPLRERADFQALLQDMNLAE